MMIRNLFLGAVLAFSLTACKSKEEKAIDDMVTMMEDMGNAIEAAGDDCNKMADSLEAISKKYDIEDLKKKAEAMKGDKDKAAEMMKKYGDRMQKAMPKLMGAMKCADDPKMKALQGKLGGMM